jgi:recombination protein RecA
MPSAATLRTQIEQALQSRFPAALSPVARTIRETAATGIPAIDSLLDGGLPLGAITEITGPASSGRTSLVLSFVAQRTKNEQVCAWVDAHDAFDSESAAANGIALRQLLWVRCRSNPSAQSFLLDAPSLNRSLIQGWKSPKPWTRLDHALRSTDLLLQAGGFASIVLDLGSTAPEHAARIPLATWFRFRQAADRTRCSLLVLAQQPLAQASAALVLECAPLVVPTRTPTVLTTRAFEVRTGRVAATQKTIPITAQRKPPAATWSATAASQREDIA